MNSKVTNVRSLAIFQVPSATVSGWTKNAPQSGSIVSVGRSVTTTKQTGNIVVRSTTRAVQEASLTTE